jgi:hypothetical protein
MKLIHKIHFIDKRWAGYNSAFLRHIPHIKLKVVKDETIIQQKKIFSLLCKTMIAAHPSLSQTFFHD